MLCILTHRATGGVLVGYRCQKIYSNNLTHTRRYSSHVLRTYRVYSRLNASVPCYGTLYPDLLKLEQEGFIRGEWKLSETNRRARCCALTKAGRKKLARETEHWATTSAIIVREAIAPTARLAAFAPPESVTVGHGNETTSLQATYVAAGYFEELGVTPALGRPFEPDEERMGAPRQVVILGDALWRRSFDGRADALGQSIVLDGRTFTVVGVAPAGSTGTDVDAADLWLPLADYPRRSLVSGNGPQSKPISWTMSSSSRCQPAGP
jgi:hypothetical protein